MKSSLPSGRTGFKNDLFERCHCTMLFSDVEQVLDDLVRDLWATSRPDERLCLTELEAGSGLVLGEGDHGPGGHQMGQGGRRRSPGDRPARSGFRGAERRQGGVGRCP